MFKVYKQWLSEDGENIAYHTLSEWFDLLNIKPMGDGKTYTTTERQYAEYGYIDIEYHGYGVTADKLKDLDSIPFYAVNADIKRLSLNTTY